MKESALLRQSKDYLGWLRNQGFLWFSRLNSGEINYDDRYGRHHHIELCEEGTADFVIMAGNLRTHRSPVVIFWETKAKGKKLTGKQSEFSCQVCQFGALYYFGDKLETLVGALQEINPGIPKPE